MVIALIFRLFNMNYEGLWNDELFTAYTSRPSTNINEIVALLDRVVHPPLHNILSYLWVKLFSYTDTSQRVFNILIGTWGAYSVYPLAKTLFNKKVAMYALGFAIVNCYLIRYSQEVRSYGMFFLLANFSFYYFIKVVRDDYSFKNAFWYVLSTTALLYTHYFALFVIAAQFFAFLFVMDRKKFKESRLRYILTFASPILLFGVMLRTIIENLGRQEPNWRDPPEIELVFKYAFDFFNDPLLAWAAIASISLALLYLIVRKFYKNKSIEKFFGGERFALTILITWIVVYFAVPYIKSSFSSETMMVNRYFIPLVTPILILFSFYLSKIKNDTYRIRVFAVLIGYSVLILFLKDKPYFTRNATFREIVVEAKETKGNQPALFLANNSYVFEPYLIQNGFNVRSDSFKDFNVKVVNRAPESYLVFLDLRPVPVQYKDTLPVVEGYEMTFSKVFKTKAGIDGTRLLQYSKVTDSL